MRNGEWLRQSRSLQKNEGGKTKDEERRTKDEGGKTKNERLMTTNEGGNLKLLFRENE